MKCVKHIRTDEVKRVDDERAWMLVQGGAWMYTNKTEWKEKVRDKAKS